MQMPTEAALIPRRESMRCGSILAVIHLILDPCPSLSQQINCNPHPFSLNNSNFEKVINPILGNLISNNIGLIFSTNQSQGF